MNALFYLHKRILINGFKRSIRKPAFVLMLIAAIAYFVLLAAGYKSFFNKIGITNASEFIVLIMVIQLYLGVPGLIQYFKRKGLLFRKADVQFVFQAPIHPKNILLFSGLRSILVSSIFMIVFCIFGCVLYPTSTLQFLLYVVVYLSFDFFIEMSLIVLCYGNETIPNKYIRFISYLLYIVLGALAVGFLLLVIDHGYSITIVIEYLKSPFIKMIPIFGWSIGLLQWIFYGYDWSNVLGTVLFILSAILLPFLAYKSKCEGEYYEEAEKFSDEYEQAIENAKAGEVSIVGAKPKKYMHASIKYKGYNAKAIFYRQFLEYKKNRFFIFSFRTFLFLLAGVALHFLSRKDNVMHDLMNVRLFVIPIIVTYYITFFGVIRSKWMKELQNYYTFLLPDTKIHKTWNATKIEHIRAFIDTMILALIGGAVLGLTPLQILLTGLVGVSVNASRIYINMMVQTIISPAIGDFKLFAQFIDLFLMLVSTGASVFVALVSMIVFNNLEAAFLGMILTSSVMACIAFLLSSIAFEKMEVME